jgi:enoyl-CoA hydratase/carnithine racemase
LRVAVITGAGKKAFCAGQDPIALGKAGEEGNDAARLARHPPTGFLGISRRTGKKAVIAAVNGLVLAVNWYV